MISGPSSPPSTPKNILQSFLGTALPRLVMSSFLLLASGRLALFAMVAVFGHTLSTAAFGEFNFVLSIVFWVGAILSIPHSNILFMAKYAGSKDNARSLGYVIFSLALVVLLCAVAAALIPLLFGYISKHMSDRSLIWTSTLILPFGIIYWQRSITRGEGHLFLALAPQEILLPLLAAAICLSLPATLRYAMGSYLAAMVTTIIISSVPAYMYFRRKFSGIKPEFDWKQWRLRIPHLTVGGLAEVSMGQWDVILIGVLLNMEQTAYYAAAARISLFSAIGLRVVETATAPLMAHLLREPDKRRARELLIHTTLISTSVGLVIAIPMFLFPGFFLHLVGPGLQDGRNVLQILVLGQLVNVSTGPVSQMLYLGGNERIYANGLWMSNIASAAGFILLVPSFGIVGGAAAKALSVTLLNIGFAGYAYRSLRRTAKG